MYVNTKTAGAIAITAAEGGIGYWSQIRSYQPSRWADAEDVYATIGVSRDFMFYEIAEWNDDIERYDFDRMSHVVTPEVIQRGVNLFLTGVKYGPEDGWLAGQWNFQPRPFADMSDLAAMDSDEADAVVQLGLFGKLIYG